MHALCFSVGAQGFSPAKTKANSRGFRDWAFLQTLPDGLFPQPLQSHRKPLRFNEALASEGTVADSIRPALSQQKMAGQLRGVSQNSNPARDPACQARTGSLLTATLPRVGGIAILYAKSCSLQGRGFRKR